MRMGNIRTSNIHKSVPYTGAKIVVDEQLLDEYDIALYMMEHNDFKGWVDIDCSAIHIKGVADIMGEEYPIKIHARF